MSPYAVRKEQKVTKFVRIMSSDYRNVNVGRSISDLEREAQDILHSKGFPLIPEIILDDEFHRFSTDQTKRDDDAGWYIGSALDGVLLFSYGNWRNDSDNGFYCGGRYRELSDEDRIRFNLLAEQRKAKIEAEHREYQENRAERARQIWSLGEEARSDNGYIVKKGLKAVHNAKVGNDGSLILPMYNEDGVISSLQMIAPDGSKRFLSGARTKGCYWWIGNPDEHRVFLAEGFATGCTIHEQMGVCTFIAYSSHNIPNVARMLTDLGKEVTIIADNDESGTGERDARKAVESCHCSMMVIPNEGNAEITDANDYVVIGGGDLRDILPDLKAVNKMLDINDILGEDIRVSWYIKKWIPTNSIGMIHGQSASGKTNIALDMLLSLSTGLSDWHGYKVSNPAKVVYLCGEGLTGVKLRIKAWAQVHGLHEMEHFKVYPYPLDLDQAAGVAEIKDQIDIQSWRPDIIVVDTVNRYMSGDENSAQDTRMFLNAVDSLRRIYGCSGIYVHHTGNDENAQKRARGSSAWRGALDWEISVSVSDDDRTRCIEQVKMKDSEIIDPVYGVIEGIPIEGMYDDDGEQVTGAVFNLCDAPQRKADKALMKNISELMLAYKEVGENGHIGLDEWSEWMVVNGRAKDRRTARNMLQDARDGRMMSVLLKGGVIERSGDGWNILNTPDTGIQLMAIEAFRSKESRKIYS